MTPGQKSVQPRTDKMSKFLVCPPCQQGSYKTVLLPRNRTCSQKPLSRGVFQITTMKVPPLIPINYSNPVSAEKIPSGGSSLSLLTGIYYFKPLLYCLILLAKEYSNLTPRRVETFPVLSTSVAPGSIKVPGVC